MDVMSTVDRSLNPLDDGFLPAQKWFIDRISSHINGFTLDCGCGRGLWSKQLREKGINVIGLDSSLRRLKLSKSEGNCENLVHGSFAWLPFRTDSFDSIILIEVIEHLPRNSQNSTLSEINRVLRVDGTFVMTTPNKYIYLLLTKAGLFAHNPEHVGELTYRQARSLFTRYFDIVDFCGKASGMNHGGVLDHLLPTIFCWDLLFVGKNTRRNR